VMRLHPRTADALIPDLCRGLVGRHRSGCVGIAQCRTTKDHENSPSPSRGLAPPALRSALRTTCAAVATPFAWRLQDVGSPQLQLQVTGLDALMARTTQAGYRFLSVEGRPIQRPFGRFVFAIDPDGVLVEFVEPATERKPI